LQPFSTTFLFNSLKTGIIPVFNHFYIYLHIFLTNPGGIMTSKKVNSNKRALIYSIDKFGTLQAVKVKLRPTDRETVAAASMKWLKDKHE